MADGDDSTDGVPDESDSERERAGAFPISRRGTLLSGAWLGALGLSNGFDRRVMANSGTAGGDGNGRGDDRGEERSSLRVSLEKKIDIADADESFRLQIQAQPDAVDGAVGAVEAAGGSVRHSFHGLVIADVPAGRVRAVADSNAVRLVGEDVQPQQLGNTQTPEDIVPKIREGELPDGVDVSDLERAVSASVEDELPTSEGVEISGADELHEMDITGEGVTIAVIDGGFDVENEQYADQVVATLGLEEGDPGFEDAYEVPGGHGDGVTDIVAAMAPDAELVLADTFNIPDFGLFDALETIEQEWPEVDVVNYSVGHLPDFRIDGFDPISLRLDDFTDEIEGIFVNSAGNSAAVVNAWTYVENVGPVPLPQENGDAYDSQGPGVFEGRGRPLLQFDAHFEEDLEVSTRLPLMTFEDVATAAAFDAQLGWAIVHWDADPDVDDQVYQARLYEDTESTRPLATSMTENPWETIDVLAEYFVDDVDVTMEVDDDAWVVTRVRGTPDVAPIEKPNPTLTLPEGQRYTFDNRARRQHPIEFRDAEGNPLLSQDPDTDGAFEDDEIVDWTTRGNRVEFTLTLDLASALDHYVSVSDPEQLEGDVETELPPPIYVEVQRVNADEEHHFDVWGQFGGVNVPTPWATDARSVGIPALSQDPDLLSVGAVQAVDLGLGEGETDLAFEKNKDDLKGYSSQGPTQDGRRGIDLAGSSHVSTNARGPIEEVFGMNGTSAAAPHVTGAVGLLAQVEDDTEAIREALFATGTGIDDPGVGDPGEDNTQIGFGYIDVASAYEELNGGETDAEAISPNPPR